MDGAPNPGGPGVAGGGDRWGPAAARSVLFLLVAIHGILPFTPVNTHPEQRIVVASVILSAVFLYLALSSWARPRRSFWGGFGLLALVMVVSSVTGASPADEGWAVKLAFLAALTFGALTAPPDTDVQVGH